MLSRFPPKMTVVYNLITRSLVIVAEGRRSRRQEIWARD